MNTYLPPNRQTNGSNGKFMKVYGESTLIIKPDRSTVQLGVEVRNLELSVAQQESSRVIQLITDSLFELGISPSNIQTSEYTILPIYDYVDGNQQFKGYQITHMLSLTIENIEQTGVVIDMAVRNGANRILNIQFTVKHIDAYYQHTLQKALENARTKAQVIAQTMRLSLDPIPAQITELTVPPPPMPFQTFSEVGIAHAQSTPVQPGNIEIEAKVEVKFYYSS
ncbi:SIMPL domain-containing protein [Mesobacillus maritimus]|uniref:SIMPL domain-containing protein n=1 Tax=Mesobacillus maritimus TaxID=1643336 RepID=UPI00384B0090